MDAPDKPPTTNRREISEISPKVMKRTKNNPKKDIHNTQDRATILANLKKVVVAGKEQRDKMQYQQRAEASQKEDDQNQGKDAPKEKGDGVLSEFDQYVICKEMEKKKQLVLATENVQVILPGKEQRDKMHYQQGAEASHKGNKQNQDKDAPKEKEDKLLSEFDQYVIYMEMEKKKQLLLATASPHTSSYYENNKEIVPTMKIVPTMERKTEQSTVENGRDQNVADQNEDEHQDIVPFIPPETETAILETCTTMTKFFNQDEEASIEEEDSGDNDGSAEMQLELQDGEGHDNTEDEDESKENFIPTTEELSEERKPEIGMHFDTLEAAQRFLNVYGYLHGFGVTKGRNYRGKKITFQCTKARKTHEPGNPQRKRKRSVKERTNCPMKVTVKLQNGQWEFIGISLDHNHDLLSTPSLTKFFSNQRSMSEEDKNLSMILRDCRIAPRRIMTIFRRLKGSRKLLSFNKQKIKNLRREDKRERNTDISHALKFVEKLQAKNQGIVLKMETDPDNTVRSLLWTDARSIMDYKLYGEFISFDTTFSTNKYNMPFAPFIGINGQGRTIVFAWALLKDQSAGSFKWAYETFLDVMEGKLPLVIMTDQDAGMKSAIDDVLSSVWHRFCFWHIMNNCSDKMGGYLAAREGMEEEMTHIIKDSLTVEEFENKWQAMIVKYDAASNKHLPLMWKWRKQWVPVYFKKVFCPFIRTTGRSEGMNSIFKDYVKRKDTIETFLIQYDLFQENVIETENEDRFESLLQEPINWGFNRIERHAGKIYTRGIFFKFQVELQNSTAFAVEVVQADKTYNLRKMFNYPKQEYHRESFQVQVDRDKQQFDCICGKFERDGILCCHVLRLFTQFDVIHIREQYINKRWTKEYREAELLKLKQNIIDTAGGSESSQISVRYAILMSKVTDVCTEVCKDANSSKEFLEEMQKLQDKYSAKHRCKPATGQQPQEEPLKDPPISTNKSVDKGNRMKRQLEKKTQKKKKNEKQKGRVPDGVHPV